MPVHRDPAPAGRPLGRAMALLALAAVAEIVVLDALGGVLLHKPPAKAPPARHARTMTAELVTRPRPVPVPLPERAPPPAPLPAPKPAPAHLVSEAPAHREHVAAIARDPGKGRKGNLDDALAQSNDVDQGAPPSQPVVVQPPGPPPAPQVVAPPPPPPPPPLPTPAYALYRPKIRLPDEMESEAQGTSLLVEFTIHADGSADAKRMSSTGYDDVDAFVMQAVQGWRFKAATVGGRPVEATVTVNIDFEQ